MSKEFFPLRPTSRPTIYAHEDTAPQICRIVESGLYDCRSPIPGGRSFRPFAPASHPS